MARFTNSDLGVNGTFAKTRDVHTSHKLGTSDDAEAHAARVPRFAKIPNSAIDDTRLPAKSLVVLAYRAMFTGKFRLHETDVRKQIGMGNVVFRKALKDLKTLGYMVRYQPQRNRRAVERVDFNVAPKGRSGFTIIDSATMADLSTNAAALLIYCKSHAVGYSVLTRHIMARFGWCMRTTRTVVKQLQDCGLISGVQHRDRLGRMNGNAYTAHNPLALKPLETRNSHRCAKIHSAKMGGADSITTETQEQPGPAKNPVRFGNAKPDRHVHAADLGEWLYGDDEHLQHRFEADGLRDFYDAFDCNYPELLDSVKSVVPDGELFAVAQNACGGRLGRRLHSVICEEIQYLATWLIAIGIVDIPIAALREVLAGAERAAAVQHADGSERWINSFLLIALQVIDEHACGGYDLLPSQDITPRQPPKTDAERISMVRCYDYDDVLANELFSARGIREFIGLERKRPNIDFVATVQQRLADGFGGQKEPGSVTSWRYFDGAAKDDQTRERLAELGMRPGDLMGTRISDIAIEEFSSTQEIPF